MQNDTRIVVHLAKAFAEYGSGRTDITITPLHNFFASRLDELPGLVSALAGAPHGRPPANLRPGDGVHLLDEWTTGLRRHWCHRQSGGGRARGATFPSDKNLHARWSPAWG